MKLENYGEIHDLDTGFLISRRNIYIFFCTPLFTLATIFFGKFAIEAFPHYWGGNGESYLLILPLGALGMLYGTIYTITRIIAIKKELELRGVTSSDKRKASKFTKQTVIAVIVVLGVILGIASCNTKPRTDKGYWGSDGYYNPSDSEMEEVWDDVNRWMDENWD